MVVLQGKLWLLQLQEIKVASQHLPHTTCGKNLSGVLLPCVRLYMCTCLFLSMRSATSHAIRKTTQWKALMCIPVRNPSLSQLKYDERGSRKGGAEEGLVRTWEDRDRERETKFAQRCLSWVSENSIDQQPHPPLSLLLSNGKQS